jgi:hypothetical protein
MGRRVETTGFFLGARRCYRKAAAGGEQDEERAAEKSQAGDLQGEEWGISAILPRPPELKGLKPQGANFFLNFKKHASGPAKARREAL